MLISDRAKIVVASGLQKPTDWHVLVSAEFYHNINPVGVKFYEITYQCVITCSTIGRLCRFTHVDEFFNSLNLLWFLHIWKYSYDRSRRMHWADMIVCVIYPPRPHHLEEVQEFWHLGSICPFGAQPSCETFNKYQWKS